MIAIILSFLLLLYLCSIESHFEDNNHKKQLTGKLN
jgi:hypothetical protein